MNDQNFVDLRSAGKSLKGWTDVSITAGITMAARSFSLGITYAWPGSNDVLSAIELGDPCEVWIGADPVLSGYVFAAPISYSSTAIRVRVSGRSRTADIVDCCPEASAIASSSSGTGDTWAGAKIVGPSGTVQAAATPQAAQWRGQKIEQIAADLCAPYGIEIVTQVPTGDPVELHAIEPGETCFESIARLLKLGQLFMTDDEAGRLVFTKAGALGDAAGGLELGVNILSGTARRDASNIYSDYVVEGQRAGSDLAYGSAAAHIRAGALDIETKRHRLLAITESGTVTPNLCRQLAAFEQRHRRALLEAVSYTVVGWRDAAGELWRPNTLVHVRDPLLGIDKKLLLAEVTYSLSSRGQLSQLNLAPIEAFEAEPAEPDSSGSSASWVDEVQ